MNPIRTYHMNDVVVFKKTTEAFGGLSNMAKGFPINVNGTIVPTSEHLYQACRFPNNPDIQFHIIHEKNPMKAKWISRAHNRYTRADWENIKYKVMLWVIEVKLSQHLERFGSVLKSTGNKQIVEISHKDKDWAAVRNGDVLVGINALGRLLMYVRDKYVKGKEYYSCIENPNIDNFLLFGEPIDVLCNDEFNSEIDKAIQSLHLYYSN